MNIYIYNYSFLNLLSVIDFLITNKIKPANIKNLSYTPNLLENPINLKIKDNPEILEKIKTNWGLYPLKVMYYVYLANDNYKELTIYYLYLNFLKYGRITLNLRKLKCVTKSLEISQKVSNEAHKLKGFIRFEEMQNKVLYSIIEPTHNVIYILANHFKKRLSNEYWMIHDKSHNIICLYDKKRIYFVNKDNLKLDNLKSAAEELYSMLWCNFYQTIGIKERKNDRCRRNFMPKKYWKNILEVRDEYEKSN